MTAFAEAVVQAADKLLPAVCPVLVPNKAKELEVVGSGVLLRVGPSEFLVTAAHVMDQARHRLHIAGPSSVVHISGQYTETRPAQDRTRDKIDLALMPLAEREVVQLRDARFLSITDFGLQPKRQKRPGDDVFFMLGYPIRRQKRPLGDVIRPQHFFYVGTEMAAADYESIGWSAGDTLLMSYEKTHTLNRLAQQVTTPDPNGMSGGGIFTLDSKLAAVPIEYLGRQHNAVAATRVGHIIQGLRQRFVHLAPHLP